MKGRTVEEIVKEWSDELEKQTQAFGKHAAALAAWDRHVLANRRSLLGVEEQLRRVAAAQEAAERKLFMLECHQKEVHEALLTIEGEAERMVSSERHMMDADAQERDRLYERAERISATLAALGSELTTTVEAVNSAQSTVTGGGQSPVGSLVQVLNNQLQALSQIEARVAHVGGDLERLQPGSRQNGNA